MLFDQLYDCECDSMFTRKRIFFENGYGASVITGGFAYSTGSKPYELAVLKGKEGDWEIDYSTKITNDVIGYLTKSQIEDYLVRIKNL